MLRNKEPELAENIDSSFEWFDLVFYRVIFVFGSRHLILVLGENQRCQTGQEGLPVCGCPQVLSLWLKNAVIGQNLNNIGSDIWS